MKISMLFFSLPPKQHIFIHISSYIKTVSSAFFKVFFFFNIFFNFFLVLSTESKTGTLGSLQSSCGINQYLKCTVEVFLP